MSRLWGRRVREARAFTAPSTRAATSMNGTSPSSVRLSAVCGAAVGKAAADETMSCAESRDRVVPGVEGRAIGFRVASIPEPSAGLLVLSATVGMLMRRTDVFSQ